ncbi:hypothetical protein DPMN_133198 [Dreissena polymorpha]|uniref:Uncharacterized protein n=1 Tax=Dreissena polymorpha TaxID=45954 RepID=A0A9D4J9J5_DREPO|nr:hypothetical protein DPMN_133198 [Dreissena polymorpha]
MSSKPKPGGKLITSDAYIEEVEMYDAKKNANAVISQSQMMCKSPMSSTSGIQKFHANVVREDSDTESDTDDSEKCCYVNSMYPGIYRDEPGPYRDDPVLHRDEPGTTGAPPGKY